MELNKLIVACVAAVVMSSLGVVEGAEKPLLPARAKTWSFPYGTTKSKCCRTWNDTTTRDTLLAMLGSSDRDMQILGRDRLLRLLREQNDLANQKLVGMLQPLLRDESSRAYASEVLFAAVEVNDDLADDALLEALLSILSAARTSNPMAYRNLQMALRQVLAHNPALCSPSLVETLKQFLTHPDYLHREVGSELLLQTLETKPDLATPELGDPLTKLASERLTAPGRWTVQKLLDIVEEQICLAMDTTPAPPE
ncbi:hypothetical protein FACS189449_09740 [Alphaproteobacteria bacterium]|nr:hypothetical protein FACS189449_09740 [Alphaproteobacteria bacterium]